MGVPIGELERVAGGIQEDSLDSGSPEEIEVLGQLLASLEGLEEMLLRKIGVRDQMQRLRQTPRESLPPRFREMAAKYFEALAREKAPEQ